MGGVLLSLLIMPPQTVFCGQIIVQAESLMDNDIKQSWKRRDTQVKRCMRICFYIIITTCMKIAALH